MPNTRLNAVAKLAGLLYPAIKGNIVHRDKFAWREAPLTYHWEDGERPD
jgi:hypothetical protein